VISFGLLKPFLTKRELELLLELPELEGLTFSKASKGLTTRKRILKKFRKAGLIEFENGKPIRLTELARFIFQIR